MEYITPMIIGSIIGYFTNWLAIRMLFRPHKEKRIFGLKLPFTPGMIPKERGRIAKSVGDTVEDYLLTPEGILEIVLSDKNQVLLKNWLRKEVLEKDKKDLELRDLFTGLGIDLAILEKKTSSLVSSHIIDYLEDEANKMEILVGIETIYSSLEKNVLELVYEKKDITERELKEWLLKQVKDYLKDLDEDVVLGELISKDLLDGVDCLIDENKEVLANKARDILMSDGIQMSLLASIRRLVDENVSKLITSFISTESIVAKVLEAINKYIYGEDFENLVIEALSTTREEIVNLKLSKLVGLEDGLVDGEILSRRFLENLDLADFLMASVKTMLEDYKSVTIERVYRYLVDIRNKSKALENLDQVFKGFFTRTLDMDIEEKDIDYLLDRLTSMIGDIDSQIFIKLIEKLKIGDIIEDEINSFEIDFAEKLILDIADKELKAITNLGAVLGAILGLLSPLIKYL